MFQGRVVALTIGGTCARIVMTMLLRAELY
jgi:hypothetical protein